MLQYNVICLDVIGARSPWLDVEVHRTVHQARTGGCEWHALSGERGHATRYAFNRTERNRADEIQGNVTPKCSLAEFVAIGIQ